jgi:hypothetical protein
MSGQLPGTVDVKIVQQRKGGRTGWWAVRVTYDGPPQATSEAAWLHAERVAEAIAVFRRDEERKAAEAFEAANCEHLAAGVCGVNGVACGAQDCPAPTPARRNA